MNCCYTCSRPRGSRVAREYGDRTLGLVVRLTRVSPTHHRFAFGRADGSGESLELETKSCLFHDLLHFAVETEAQLAAR